MNPQFIKALQNLRQARQRMFNWDQWKGIKPTNEGWASTPWQGNSPQVIVYDPKTGKAFPSPQVAISAGVSNFSYNLPPGMRVDWSYWDQFKQPKDKKVEIKPLRISDQTVTPPSGIMSDIKSDTAADPAVDVEPKKSGPTRSVIVYGPDGKQYANPAAAEAAGVTDWSYTKGGKPASEDRTKKPDYDPESMKGTAKEIAGQFKEGEARQDAKTWRANQMAAAKKKYGGDNMTKDQKTSYIKQRNKIANRHRIMIDAGEKTLKDGAVIGKDPTA